MRHIERQDIDLALLYSQCMGQKRDGEVQKPLKLAEPVVLKAAEQYEQLGQTMTLYGFVQPTIPAGGATDYDLVDLYQTTLVRKEGAGRWAYDRIKAAAPHGTCPLCGQRTVGTLDHYLPKESHWTLAIAPDNLIPACRDCNFAKRAHYPRDESTQSFHPYFDVTDDSQWLFASAQHTGGLSVLFYVKDVPGWSVERQLRARHHFNLFELQTLYATHAAEELVNMKYRLVQLRAKGGAEVVRCHLREEALSRQRAHINSWQTALYQALSEDEAFCAGDFSQV